MLVPIEGLIAALKELQAPDYRGLDTETTGLTEDDELFALIISDEKNSFYFNFNPYPDIDPRFVLPRASLKLFKPIFDNPDAAWDIQNAKFDLRMLAKEGLHVAGKVHCTLATERILKNNLLSLGLADLAERRGWAKDDAVEEYISKHHLYEWYNVPGKKKRLKNKHFDKVPWQVMVPYGDQDAKLHKDIAQDQRREILELSKNTNYPSLVPLYENEMQLVKTCFKMERRGILINKPYVAHALEFEIAEMRKHQGAFQEASGRPYQDSNNLFQEVFDKVGEKYPVTLKGNPSFAAEALEEMTSPIAETINKVRYHEKRAGTYYSSYLYFADQHNVIHADIRQAGTETGRFSYRDPNLQNIPKEAEPEDQETPYHVRSSFIPRPGHFFYAIDYSQQEFRMMLDWAGEHKLIADVMAGADVHQATADLCKIIRKQAKTINFGLLYGMGIRKLAKDLGLSVADARELMQIYFSKLTQVGKFKNAIMNVGQRRGFVFNWFGRRNHIARSDWAYILPNHFIQGGCADVLKIAMNKIDKRLEEMGSKTSMLIQVHDELLLETPFGEEGIILDVKNIMENVYKPQNGMKLTTEIEHAYKSWGFRDKIKGICNGEVSSQKASADPLPDRGFH